MVKRFHILLFIFCWGFFGAPSYSLACGKQSCGHEQSYCIISKMDKTKKVCCCNKNRSNSKKNIRGCGGNCNEPMCQCPSIQLLFTIQNVLEFKSNLIPNNTSKQKFNHNETRLTSGFLSIWLPPKIT